GARAVGLGEPAATMGTLVAFVQYIQRFFEPMRDLSGKYTILQSSMAGAERIAVHGGSSVWICGGAAARQGRRAGCGPADGRLTEDDAQPVNTPSCVNPNETGQL
ncbi:MAG TPA: hypothetical protein VIV12_00940, partial [Streptosporangiaceae bacterium]